MTTLNTFDGAFWFLYDDATGFGPLDIWFTADESIHGEWKPNHDFQAIDTVLGEVTDKLTADEHAAIIALIDQLFAEYQQGEAA